MKKLNLSIILFFTVIAFFSFSNLAVAANSLDAADGSPTNAVYVDNDGNVGIGTSSPSKLLHLYSNLNTYNSLLNIENPNTGTSAVTAMDISANSGVLALGILSSANTTYGGYGTSGDRFIYSSQGGGADLNIINAYSSGNIYFYAGGNASGTPKLSISSSGNIGIGTTNPVYTFDVRGSTGIYNNATQSNFNIYHPTISANSTNYYKALDLNAYEYNINSGVTDSGYRIGLGIQAYVSDAHFQGTLNTQFGLWVRNGSYGSSAGTINNSYGIFINTLTSGGTTFGNLYGLYQDSTAAKNYFAGNVGIGTTSPDYKLDVLGTIRAQEVKVATGWSDFVFDENYNLPSLTQVESYIEENKHLPDIPSANEIQENGLSMAEMMAKQMQKIEELTLYMIDLKKENEDLKNRVTELEQNN